MRKTVTVLLFALMLFSVVGCNQQAPAGTTGGSPAVSGGGGQIAVIETSKGTIKMAFDSDIAPKTVENFQALASRHFYDGTTFHRVIPGFMIQGGDPLSRDPDRSKHGSGGPGYTIKAEFSEKPHVRGSVSMARSENPDSAGSQFFICVAEASHLNGKYTQFAHVVEGMDVADAIVAVPRDENDNPKEPVVIRKITLETAK